MEGTTKSLADLYREQNGGAVQTETYQAPTQGPTKTDEELIKERLQQQYAQNAYQGDENVQVVRDESTTGIVIEKKEEVNEGGIRMTGMPSESLANLEETLKQMDQDIAEAKEQAEIAKAEAEERAAQEAEEAERKAALEQENYNKAVIIIDKLNMGNVNFTEEERAKMEKVSKIEVQEIETLSLETLKINKDPQKNIDKVLQAKKNVGGTSNIVAIASGYTAVMCKCSLFELANLFIDKENIVETQLSKWSFIYSKMVSSSVKFKSFDDFIKRTALVDYNNFIFGILAASYPDIDEIGLSCIDPKCVGKIVKKDGKDVKVKDYEFSYSVRSLIRPERMSEALLQRFTNIIDNSYVTDTAEAIHKASPVMNVKRYRLPGSGYIIDAGIETVHDFIYNASRTADTLTDDKYRQSLTTATMIRKLYIPDENGGFYEFEDKLDITKAIYELNQNVDIKAILKVNAELAEDLTMDFGFVNVTCPYCKNVTEFVPVDPDDILFHKYRQETATIG